MSSRNGLVAASLVAAAALIALLVRTVPRSGEGASPVGLPHGSSDGVPSELGVTDVAVTAGGGDPAIAEDSVGRPESEHSVPSPPWAGSEPPGQYPDDPPSFEGIVVRVVLSSGEPVSGAKVFLTRWGGGEKVRRPHESAVTDGSGRCRFWGIPEGVAVVALVRGYLPASIPDFASWYAMHVGDEVVLTVDRETLGIRGRVLGVEGNPAVDWSVAVLDETRLLGCNTSAEDLMRFPQPAIVAEELGNTDERGEFEVWGLLDRDYTIVAEAEDGCSYAFAEDVPAGSESITLCAREDAFHEVLRGRVVGWNGTPIAGASVGAGLDATWNIRSRLGAGTQSDEQGRFVLQRVPRFLARTWVHGERIVPGQETALDPANLSDEVTVVVEREAPLRIEISDDVRLPLHVWGRDADGARLGIRVYLEDGSETGGCLHIEDRTTPVVWLREGAARLTFHDPDGYDRDAVQYDVAVSLNPDVECNVVRLGF